MNGMNDIIQVAVDAYRGNTVKYSVGDSMELLHKALIEANNGKTTMDYKSMRDGKCNGLFTLLEEILSRTVVEGVQKSDFVNSMVDFRNVALGDKKVFVVEDDTLFTVSDVAEGTQGIRRQRLSGRSEITLPTSLKIVKIYEELNRVLSGAIDFNSFIARVSQSFERKLLDDVFMLWENATADDFGGNVYFPAAGAYDEDALLELIAHVEAAAGGKPAKILGTKVALRNLAPSIQGTDSKSDLYSMGYYGKFYGTDVLALPQRHKVNSSEFLMDDKTITVVATDDKPIKCTYEGQSTIIMGEPTTHNDLTYEYSYADRYGLGIVLAGGNAGIGRYKMV